MPVADNETYCRMLDNAKENHFAYPAINVTSLTTANAVLQGLAIALVAGTIVGIAMGRLKVFDRMLNFYVNGLYTMPMIALLPLITIWFGYSSDARMATIIFAAFSIFSSFVSSCLPRCVFSIKDLRI